MSTSRTTISLPIDILLDVDYISRRLGITKSAVISTVLLDPITSMASELRSVPENPNQYDKLRSRGKSKELVEARLRGLMEIGNDLLSDSDNK